ncbi:hypothetical protein [Pseudactinotalea suaedae]|uniref:hypothetical protein n=1 Tax=Pseudactinotalea suaedae TaxID=1524924 RepID=UPI0012E121A4|nr:hypothetical protein [Pseudactinotalea suaedae]
MQPAAAPPELVVRSDLAALHRRFRTVLILHGVLTLALLAAVVLLVLTSEQALRSFVVVFLLLLASQIFQIAFQCYHWGGRLAISRPLTIDGWGMELQSQQGTVRLPWEAVVEVRRKVQLGQPLLRFVLHPQAMPGQVGVEADPASWAGYQKRGLLLGGTGLLPGVETILPAIQHYSQGRTRIA